MLPMKWYTERVHVQVQKRGKNYTDYTSKLLIKYTNTKNIAAPDQEATDNLLVCLMKYLLSHH